MKKNKIKYSDAILQAHHYLLTNIDNFFVIGQGLWSPWYVGATMKDLDKKYGKDKIKKMCKKKNTGNSKRRISR